MTPLSCAGAALGMATSAAASTTAPGRASVPRQLARGLHEIGPTCIVLSLGWNELDGWATRRKDAFPRKGREDERLRRGQGALEGHAPQDGRILRIGAQPTTQIAQTRPRVPRGAELTVS